MTSQEIINQISYVLMEADEDFIEHIANQVLGRKVRYDEDGDIFYYADGESI